MTENELVKTLLAELAVVLDAPTGPGSGAVCLQAIAALEELEEQAMPPASNAPPPRPPD